MDTSTTNVTKLTGPGNYRVWKMQIASILASRGLWKIVSGEDTGPETPEDPDTDSDHARLKGKTPANTEHLEEVKAFGKLQCQAYSIIITTISQDICLSLEHTQDPKDAWTILSDRFQPDDIVSKYSIFLQWVYLRFDGKDLQKYCRDYEKALQTCAAVDIKLDEDLQIDHFIAQITPFFEFYTTLLRLQISQHQAKNGRGSMPFNLNEVIKTALQENGQK